MTDFDSFKVGDRVAHIVIGDGTVTSVAGAVYVKFDRITAKGRHVEGVYDPTWFRLYPGRLSHRSEP